ncbi:MAG TPA: hypothetical protein VF505_18210 [Thermoanaerobaculia bacterium]
MKRSTLLLTLLSLAALPLAAQVNDTYVIPVSANTSGAFGTSWLTQFSVFNPQPDRDLKITVVFIPTGGAQGDSVVFTVPANAVAYSDNVLDDLQFKGPSGALLVYADDRDNPGDKLTRAFLVVSNTYNNARSGTYGQTIPGVWTGLQDYATDGISAVVHGIRNISSQGWRTNIGAVNLGRCSATLRVSVFDVDGNTILKKAAFPLPPLGHIQSALPVTVDRGSIEFFVDDPCVSNADNAAVVFAYSSTIDQLSGDPTYQSPVLLADPKTIFAKKATAEIGKAIDNARAKSIRDASISLGQAQLVRDASGYRITR